MSIITKAGSPVKGSRTDFTLSKAELALIITDGYYSDMTKWKKVILNYKSSIGDQHKILRFDATASSPTAIFFASLSARDVFKIYKIVIEDFDGGAFNVPRSQLVTSEFDVDLAAAEAENFILLEDGSQLLFEDSTNAILD